MTETALTERVLVTPLPNYLKKILEGFEVHPEWNMPGKVVHLHIFHDDWCAIHEGGACNCNPDIQAELAK